MIGLIVMAVLAIAIAGAIALYNGLVGRRNVYRNAFSQIDVQLKRRHDLVPNLVEAARAYMQHERETLEAVVRARGQAALAAQRAGTRPESPGALTALAGAEAGLSSSLARLLAVAESYPDLKANATMAGLTEELASTENRIAFARQAYNDAVMEYNTARQSLPAAAVAASLGFGEATAYDAATADERAPVRVAFR